MLTSSPTAAAASDEGGTQFTCFASTKVQILTSWPTAAAGAASEEGGSQFTCFTSTRVQILTQQALVGLRAVAVLAHTRSIRRRMLTYADVC
jgi:hypothetical protein